MYTLLKYTTMYAAFVTVVLLCMIIDYLQIKKRAKKQRHEYLQLQTNYEILSRANARLEEEHNLKLIEKFAQDQHKAVRSFCYDVAILGGSTCAERYRDQSKCCSGCRKHSAEEGVTGPTGPGADLCCESCESGGCCGCGC